MLAFLGVIGFIVSIVFVIMGIVSAIRKKQTTKRNFIIAGVAFVIFIGAIAASSSSTDKEASGAIESSASPKETNSSSQAEKDAAAKKAQEAAASKEAADKKKAEEAAAKEAEAKKPKLEVISHKAESDQFTQYVVGTIKNNTKKEYSYVQVEINLYDKDGAQVGSTLANTNNLEAGGTWKFKAIVINDDVAEYKIKDVTGF